MPFGIVQHLRVALARDRGAATGGAAALPGKVKLTVAGCGGASAPYGTMAPCSGALAALRKGLP